jgi:hypothetical protein
MSVRLSTWSNSDPTGQIMKSHIFLFFENLSRKFNSLKSDKNNGCFTQRPTYFFDILTNSLGMRNVSDERSENQNTHFKFNNFCLKIMPFMRKYIKILLGPVGHR